MLTRYSFENYKAFASGEIEIKPITVFLGTNSSGKSAVARLPLMLYQTANRVSVPHNSSKMRFFDYNGDVVEMGSPSLLLRQQDRRHRLSVSLEMRLDEDFDTRKNRLLDEYIDSVWETFRTYVILAGARNPGAAEEIRFGEEMFAHMKERGKARTELLGFIRHLLPVLRKALDSADFWEISSYSRTSGRMVRRRDLKSERDYEHMLELLEVLAQEQWHVLSFRYELSLKENDADYRVQSVRIERDGRPLASIEFDPVNGKLSEMSFLNIFPSLDDTYASAKDMFLPEAYRSFFEIVSDRLTSAMDSEPITVSIARRVLALIFRELRSQFSVARFAYVPPLRDHPQRFYHRRHKPQDNVGISHFQVGSLLRSDDDLLRLTNGWFDRFDTELKVKNGQEDILQILTVRNGKGNPLPLVDIGFGVAQIMPVVVQSFLASENAVVVLEQPEVHLHPDMQSDLVDLFISALHQRGDRRFIIETHSVPFMYRLRRKLAEGKEIDRDSVAVYAFEIGDDNEGHIQRVAIDEGGDIKWPSKFTDRQLDDMSAFSKEYSSTMMSRITHPGGREVTSIE